ncbi:hypothetical protein WICANDRAFT_79031 [Wickerhamomyces anomalus NRRL Y-366-8]|uniref:Uncharacterized protein n=1 Tax=Wickerhamomyces anomalus (strain ATCC 58044 / CBS 1984 / NCYC 433 / NRRL Y-366-8) TaxID=683960 RepID=A0A1E3P4Z9_WICAA|nr:uncharacterized protein WICANDRAFT_79031 [Wickerhamomyces anomalus NRRL Y-366-8]ODQ60433.1 hypothetical protein WICANDRAFT_79031 [Wickerhamomyces anomalus NRRL Y-366-8]
MSRLDLSTKFQVICYQGQLFTMLFAKSHIGVIQKDEFKVMNYGSDGSFLGPDTTVFTLEAEGKFRYSIIKLDDDHFLINSTIGMHPPISVNVKYSDYFEGLPLPISNLEISARADLPTTPYREMNARFLGFLKDKYEAAFGYHEEYALEIIMSGGNREFISTCISREFIAKGIEKIYYKNTNRQIDESDDSDSTSADEIDSFEANEQTFNTSVPSSTGNNPPKEKHPFMNGKIEQLPIIYPPVPFGGQSPFYFGVGKGNPFGKFSREQPFY